jgi:hypothetical protein
MQGINRHHQCRKSFITNFHEWQSMACGLNKKTIFPAGLQYIFTPPAHSHVGSTILYGQTLQKKKTAFNWYNLPF